MKQVQQQFNSRHASANIKEPALPTQQKITLVACFCSDGTVDAITYQLSQRNILCDAHQISDFYASKDLRAIRNSVVKSGNLWMMDTDIIGKNAFSLLQKLIEEEAIGYYLHMSPRIILPTSTMDATKNDVDKICYKVLRELNISS